MPTPPAECATKQEVRRELDRIDNAIVELLAERHTYVSRMAELKKSADEARDPARIEEMIGKIRARAHALNLDGDQAELLWRTLIDWNVNYEKTLIAAREKS